MEAESMWGAADAARHIALPQEGDDKYTALPCWAWKQRHAPGWA